MSPIYYSLHFVLLFPSGQLSWHLELQFNLVDENIPDGDGDESQPEPGQESGNVVAI